MKLGKPSQDFILHWGEMGSRWGVNRSQAQIHALLHLASKPLPADEIAETLGIARSNVSTALKELQSWKLVRVERALGDRRDHFIAEDDMFELVRKVVEGRREREFAPTIEAVRQCVADAKTDKDTDAATERRLADTLETMELLDNWYREVAKLPRGAQIALLKHGATLLRMLPKGGAANDARRDLDDDADAPR